jgi:hypothetical protein
MPDMTAVDQRQRASARRRVVLGGWALSLAAWSGSPALAQSVPRDHHERVSLRFDRSAIPEQWQFRPQLAAHYTQGQSRGARTAFVCRSAVDTALGACAIAPANVTGPAPTPVLLRFTESRSGLQVDLSVSATKIVTVASSTCTHVRTAFHSNRNYGVCGRGPYDVSRYILSIERAQLQKIPVGGVWRGHLTFDVRELGSALGSAIHRYDIELNVTDRHNAQIYFPTLSNTSPRVSLDLRKRAGPGYMTTVYGGRSVDMCFYDGFGSNSTGALRVRVSDGRDNFPIRPPGSGLLVRRGTLGTLPEERIEYRGGLAYAGAHQWLRVGDPVASVFAPVSTAPIRIVRLPGIPTPVACSPGMLVFEVVPFIESDKDAGGYEGPLRVEMFVDAALM